MELRNFFRNSLGLGIFGLTKGDYTNAKICFTPEGASANDSVTLDLSLLPGYPSSLEMQSACKTFSVKDTECLKVVKPTLDYLEQKLAASGAAGVVKVKVTLVSLKDMTREPMEFDADSTSWKWPSYYTE